MAIVHDYGPYVLQIVDQGWDLYSGMAVDSYSLASDLITDLSEFTVSSVNFDTSFTLPSDNIAPYNKPTAPSTPTVNWSLQLPQLLDIKVPSMPALGSAPTANLNPPPLDFSGQPGAINVSPPPDAPDLDDVSVPDAPTLTFPDTPDLVDIDFPDPPDIIEWEFEGERPEFEGEVPDETIDFTEEAYSSDLLDRMRDEVSRMLDDGTGMPSVVELMLVDRARTREDREATRIVQQAMEEAAARGFTLPPGHIMRRVQEARQANQDQANAFSREVFVQRRQEEIQNFQFALAQGIAMENMLLQAHLAVQQRAFEFATAVVDLAFRELEAKINVYNAAIQGYQVDAAVYETKLRAEINKLEKYRIQIQAEGLKVDANRAHVEVYQAQLSALETQVNVYRSQVEAARVLAEKNNATVRAYVGLIDGYRAQIEAKKVEWDAWATKVQGQLGRVNAYEAETRAFAARVSAYEAEVRAKALKPEIETRIEELKIRENLARLEGYKAEAGAEASRMQGIATVYGSQAQVYAAEGQIAQFDQAAKDRQYNSLVEARHKVAQHGLAEAQLNVEQVMRSGQLVAQAIDGAARAASQLAAGAMSAVSLSASGSASINEQWSGSLDG